MYPIYFTTNTCVACGKENCIELFNMYNKPIQIAKVKDVTYAKCSNCGAEYVPVMDIQDKSIIFRDKENIFNIFLDKYESKK